MSKNFKLQTDKSKICSILIDLHQGLLVLAGLSQFWEGSKRQQPARTFNGPLKYLLIHKYMQWPNYQLYRSITSLKNDSTGCETMVAKGNRYRGKAVEESLESF